MDNSGDSLHCTKMGADSLAENTPNAPKVLDFNEKRLNWASVVRDPTFKFRHSNVLKKLFCSCKHEKSSPKMNS